MFSVIVDAVRYGIATGTTVFAPGKFQENANGFRAVFSTFAMIIFLKLSNSASS
jgi:hypothetical protein